METKDALEIAQENYTEYSKYVAMGRAYPNILDGCKSSYKRAIYGMWKDGPRSIVKCAKLASYALPYHPHPTSISSVIVQLGNNGNKLKLMDTQGNWGDSTKGIEPSADRYIGGKLSDLAIKLFCDSCEYVRTIKGEIDEDEPIALPALIPLCFINGLSGIPSGLPTLNIPPINIIEMIEYYIEILKNKSLDYTPNWIPSPNFEINVISSKDEWKEVMTSGKGTIKLAPVMSKKDNTITITALPQPKTIEHIRKILDKELVADKIDIRDESTSNTCIVVEKVPRKQCDMVEIYWKLYKGLQSSESLNMAFFGEDKIFVPCSFERAVKANLGHLIDTHNNRIIKQLESNRKKLRVLEIIESIKNSNDVSELSKLDSQQALDFIETKYGVDREISNEVMKKPISYLTKEHEKEIIDLQNLISSLETDKNDIYDFLLKKYRSLKREMTKLLDGKFRPTTFIQSKRI